MDDIFKIVYALPSDESCRVSYVKGTGDDEKAAETNAEQRLCEYICEKYDVSTGDIAVESNTKIDVI